MAVPDTFLIKALGQDGSERFRALQGRKKAFFLNPAEKQEYYLLGRQIEDAAQQLESGGLENVIDLDKLRYALELAGDDRIAQQLGDKILQDSGFPGKVFKADTGQWIIHNDVSNNYYATNPEGLDPSDIGRLKAQGIELLPIAASIGGAVLGGPAAAPAAGLGNIAGEMGVEGFRTALENDVLPGRQSGLQQAGDIALAGARGAAINAASVPFGKLAGLATGPIVRGASKAFANKATGEAVEQVSGKVLTGAESILKKAGDNVVNALLQTQKNPISAILLGSEQIVDNAIEQGLKAGLTNEQIKQNITTQIEAYRKQIQDSVQQEFAAQTSYQGAKEQVKGLANVDKGHIDAVIDQLNTNVNLALDNIQTKYTALADDFINAKAAGNIQQETALRNNLKAIDDQLTDIDQQMTGIARFNVQSKTGQKAADITGQKVPVQSELEANLKLMSGDTAALGIDIRNKATSAWIASLNQEKMGFDTARELAKNEIVPIADITPLANQIKEAVADGTMSPEVGKQVINSVGSGSASTRDMFRFVNNLSAALQSGDLTKAEFAVIANVRGKLISDEGSIMKQAASQSPAIQNYLQSSEQMVKRNDDLGRVLHDGIIGKADWKTGNVIRNPVLGQDVYNKYIEVLGKEGADSDLAKNFLDFAGVDQNLQDKAVASKIQEIYTASGNDVDKTIITISRDPTLSRYINQNPTGSKIVGQLQSASSQAQDAALNVLYGGEDAALGKIDLSAQRKALMPQRELAQNELTSFQQNAAKEQDAWLAGNQQQQVTEQSTLDPYRSGLDPVYQNIEKDQGRSLGGVEEANKILNFANATPEQKTTMFRSRYIGEPLAKLEAEGAEKPMQSIRTNMEGLQYSDQSVPHKLTPFGEEAIAPDVATVRSAADAELAYYSALAEREAAEKTYGGQITNLEKQHQNIINKEGQGATPVRYSNTPNGNKLSIDLGGLVTGPIKAVGGAAYDAANFLTKGPIPTEFTVPGAATFSQFGDMTSDPTNTRQGQTVQVGGQQAQLQDAPGDSFTEMLKQFFLNRR